MDELFIFKKVGHPFYLIDFIMFIFIFLYCQFPTYELFICSSI